MSAEIDYTLGRAAFARSSDSARAWWEPGKGLDDSHLILPTDTLDTILAKGGLEWGVAKAPLLYAPTIADVQQDTRPFENRMVTYRTDNGAPLGVVSQNRYHLDGLQPRDVVGFLHKFCRDKGLKLETLGALKGGRVVWALASLGPDFLYLAPGGMADRTQFYVRFQTSFDGSRVTSLVLTSIRQVCANTEAAIEHATSGQQYKVPHCRPLNSDDLAKAFGLLGEQYRLTCDAWNTLQATAISADDARQFFLDLLGVDAADVDRLNDKGKPVISGKLRGQLNALAAAYVRGPGANLPGVSGTAYGLLQAVTHVVDHESIVRDTYGEGGSAARMSSAWLGTGAALKARAREMLLAKVAA